MEGVKIELKQRGSERADRRRDEEEQQRFYYKNEENHSFHFDKPYKKQVKDTVLKVKTLELPSDLRTFNTGSSLDRWVTKRPRLKSSGRPHKVVAEETDDEDYLDVIPEESYLDDDGELYEEPIHNPYEIDSNVQKLIEDTVDYKDDDTPEIEEMFQRKKVRRKSLQKAKRKGKRRISIVLSKPPSPETVQVIRVDVTSNCSFDDAGSSEEDDYCERFQSIIDDKEEEKEKSVEQDFTVMCRKLTLSARERKIETKAHAN